MSNYRMNPGRHAKYYFQFSDRETGEVVLEGEVTGANKSDCRNQARVRAMSAGILNHKTMDKYKCFIISSEKWRGRNE